MVKNGRSFKILYCNLRNRMIIKNVNWIINNIGVFKMWNLKIFFCNNGISVRFLFGLNFIYFYG